MDRILKFLRRLQPKVRASIVDVIERLLCGDWKGLDIKALQGQPNWYRCRVGQVRIIFRKTDAGKIVLYDVGFRGNIYKN